jgi:hypothetical protein
MHPNDRRYRRSRLLTYLLPGFAVVVLVAVGTTGSHDPWRGYDITADWLISRSLMDGNDHLRPISELASDYGVEHLAIEGIDLVHPRLPGAVLVLAPLGFAKDVDAVNLALLGGNVIAALLLLRNVAERFRLGSKETIVGGLLIAGSGMMHGALHFGTWSLLIALMIERMWAHEERADTASLVGMAAGFGMTVKLYPGAGLAALALRGRWRSFGVGVLAFSGLNVLGLVVLSNPTDQYIERFQAANQQWLSFEGNMSLPATLHALGMAPAVSVVGGIALVVIAAGALIRKSSWVSDDPWPLVIVGALLAQPVVWGHYWLTAVPVLGWIWKYTRQSPGVHPARGLALLWVAGWWVLPAIPLDVTSNLRQGAHLGLGVLLMGAVGVTYLWRGGRAAGLAPEQEAVEGDLEGRHTR